MECLDTDFVLHLRSRNLSEQTIRVYRRYAREYLAAVDVLTVSRRGVHAWANRVALEYAPSTANVRIAVVRVLHRWLVDDERRIDNPAVDLTGPRRDTDDEVPPEPDELRRVLARLNLSDRALATLLYACGLRITEGRSIERRHISVSGRTARVLGKGRKWRTVPIPSGALELLEQYLDTETSERPFEHVSPGGFARRLRAAAIEAGFDPKPWHPHMLRHACATHLMRRDVHQKKIQRLLGHSDVSQTQRYQHVDVSDLVAAVEQHPLNDVAPPSRSRPRMGGTSTAPARVTIRSWAV